MTFFDSWELEATGFEMVSRIDALQMIARRPGRSGTMLARKVGDDISVSAVPTDDHRYVVRLSDDGASEACQEIMRRFGSYGGDGSEGATVIYFYDKVIPFPYGDGREPATEASIEAIPGVLKCIKLSVKYSESRYEARDGLGGFDLYHTQ